MVARARSREGGVRGGAYVRFEPGVEEQGSSGWARDRAGVATADPLSNPSKRGGACARCEPGLGVVDGIKAWPHDGQARGGASQRRFRRGRSLSGGVAREAPP